MENQETTRTQVNFSIDAKKLWQELYDAKKTSQNFQDFVRSAFHEKIDNLRAKQEV